MTYKSQTHSAQDDAKAREMAEAFMKLWQEKWGEMMQQQGWPSDFAMPNPSVQPWQMPFMSPFMQGFGNGFGGGFTPTSPDAARIEALEKRVAALEKATKAKAKTKTAAAARKKPAQKPSKG